MDFLQILSCFAEDISSIDYLYVQIQEVFDLTNYRLRSVQLFVLDSSLSLASIIIIAHLAFHLYAHYLYLGGFHFHFDSEHWLLDLGQPNLRNRLEYFQICR